MGLLVALVVVGGVFGARGVVGVDGGWGFEVVPEAPDDGSADDQHDQGAEDETPFDAGGAFAGLEGLEHDGSPGCGVRLALRCCFVNAKPPCGGFLCVWISF